MINLLIDEMINYYSGDPKRIQHFIKVYTYSKLIGENENIDKETLKILTASAVTHDIGIKKAEQIHGYNNGKLQEQYGPEIALPMLEKVGYSDKECKRICWLIGHHHTYKNIDGIDYQILVEADFLVNMQEDNMSYDSILNSYSNIFKTTSGKRICKLSFGLK